ncbi:MAG TPA: nicotinate-nucleotide diphosphorylase (carboxylating), partial [Pyrinomonadaceae bacterium]|nr:nicotinate-nucleotide diphosphorylase (carboxylating) [Pyrinomonadaceae bacterium]
MHPEISLGPEILSSIERALAEDIGAGDVTTESIIPIGAQLTAAIIAKQAGVVAGLDVARATFELLDQEIRCDTRVRDGGVIAVGDVLVEIRGSARAMLTAERTALNFLGRMSGIATATRRFVDETKGTAAKILDTRKTAPNLRACDKLAVRLGGGENHRFGL